MKTYKCKKSYVVFTVLGCLAVLIPFCIISFVIDKTSTARFVWPALVLIYIMFSLVPQVKTVYKNPTEVHDDYVQFPYMRGVYDVKYRDVREIKYSALRKPQSVLLTVEVITLISTSSLSGLGLLISITLTVSGGPYCSYTAAFMFNIY